MTRSTNCSELRKMSNPIPINPNASANAWQMRSQKNIEESTQYDPGIIDQCVNNSISPHSTYSISPSFTSPSQSLSPIKELNRLNPKYSRLQHNPHHQFTSQNYILAQQLKSKTDNEIQINQILNDNNNTNFDVQSELESLFVNATLSDTCLNSSDMQNVDDSSNTSTKLNELNNDELGDVEMNFNSSVQQSQRLKKLIKVNNFIKQEKSKIKINRSEQNDDFENDRNEDETNASIHLNQNLFNLDDRIDSNPSTNTSYSISRSLNEYTSSDSKIQDINEKNDVKTVDTSSCDPVLTQIALNTSNSQINTSNKNLNMSNNLIKRSLLNTSNNNDDICLASINVSNLTTNQSTNNFTNSPSFATSSILTNNFSNYNSCFSNKISNQDITSPSVNSNSTAPLSSMPLNIVKLNSLNNSEALNQYSMSLPSNYSNFFDIFPSSVQVSNMTQRSSVLCTAPILKSSHVLDTSIDLENNCNMEEPNLNLVNNSNTLQDTDSSRIDNDDDNNTNNYSTLSTSLPTYSIDDYMNKFKSQNIQLLQQTTRNQNYNHQNNNNFANKLLNNNNNINRLLNVTSSPHLNKLLTNNNKIINTFNSDSNLSCTNTAISSIPSLTSPLSSVHDDEELIHKNDDNNNNFSGNVGGICSVYEDEYDELDSDDDSLNNDALFDLMNKNRDTYFWQYNIQSKGPKTKKVLTLRNKDPHLHRDFFDPVYQLQTISSRGTSLNKLRKGDGNDVTPNSDKLYNLGIQIRDFIQKSYQMNSSNNNDMITNEKINLKREKNKIASRACRLKKKAQHEANKLKLNGLNEEHKQLVETINIAKDLIKKRLKTPNQLPSSKLLTEILDEVSKQKLTVKVAGNADNYVHGLMQQIEKDRSNNILMTANINSCMQHTDIRDENLNNALMLFDSNNSKASSE